MKMKLNLFLSIIFISSFAFDKVWGHCQVPCGIYADQLRFEQMLEDQSTIAKAQQLIVELSSKTDPFSKNQLTRWVSTKEDHASKIQKTIFEYFLVQRIKSSNEKYQDQLVAAHQVLVAAMKCKQSTDSESSDMLRKSIVAFHKFYK